MDSLPLETLQRVFELACTDGGSTGNSLSLTSKGIRTAARRVRFHSLYLTADRAPFQEFVTFLARESGRAESERPRVRHLLLDLGGSASWYKPSFPAKQELLRTYSGPTNSPSHAAAQSTVVSDVDEDSQESAAHLITSEAVQKLITLVAGDLWSLFIHVGAYTLHPDLQFPILEHTFPLVREAAFLGICEPKHLLRVGAPPSLAFPAATHLHISPPLNNSQLSLPEWCTIAPHVSHLYISGIGHRNQVQQLADAVGVHVEVSIFARPPPESPPPIHPRTYPTVRHLLVEPGPRPRRGYCGNPSIAHSAMRHGLVQIVQECTRTPGVDAVAAAFQPRPEDRKFTEGDVRHLREWRELVEGTEGWWAGLREE
ncbi:hypothetical protein BC628DRAFT_626964 [Trametes gibbosa]|nr:hypothetical protein BC628DRAFT_626964 [Trametes gibbosa]